MKGKEETGEGDFMVEGTSFQTHKPSHTRNNPLFSPNSGNTDCAHPPNLYCPIFGLEVAS